MNLIHARRLPDGRLRDITYRLKAHPEDVPLVAMPTDEGPWTYDAAEKRAVPAPLTAEERLQRQALPLGLTAALSLRLSSSWSSCTSAEQTLVAQILDSAGSSTLAALRAP